MKQTNLLLKGMNKTVGHAHTHGHNYGPTLLEWECPTLITKATRVYINVFRGLIRKDRLLPVRTKG